MNLDAIQKRWLAPAEIHREADELRQKHCPAGEIPIDSLLMAEDMGIYLDEVADLYRLVGSPGCISMSGQEILIDLDVFRKPNMENRLRFTVAHELGHVVLHRDLFTYLRKEAAGSVQRWNDLMIEYQRHSLSSTYEWQANEFAGRLLVPPQSLALALQPAFDELRRRKIHPSVFTVEQIAAFVAPQICERFKVAEKTMRIRIEKESIVKTMLEEWSF